MTRRVRLSARAVEDLIQLHQWIATKADTAIAGCYLDRVEQRVGSLADYPGRGTPRDDLYAGLRTLPFERRLVIAYRVGTDEVDVLRIVNALRDLAPLLG